METTMNYRGITRYSYSTMKPTALTALFRRLARFFKSLLEEFIFLNKLVTYGHSP